MNRKLAHDPACRCGKEDCPHSQDVQRKADWLGVSFPHAAHILETLEAAPSLLGEAESEAESLKQAVKNVAILASTLQGKGGVEADLRPLVSHCYKFLAIIIRHVSSRDGDISPSVGSAIEVIQRTVIVMLAMRTKATERKLWSFIPGSGVGQRVNDLREDLRRAWNGCRAEVSLGENSYGTMPAETMAKQMDAVIEKAVRIKKEHNYYGGHYSSQVLESHFHDPISRFPGGIDSYLIYNDRRRPKGAESSTDTGYQQQSPQRSNSLPQPPIPYRSTEIQNTYFTTPSPSPFSANLILSNTDEQSGNSVDRGRGSVA
ncbi:hypothetical protein NMY22_g16242 [Coprinellus aureogranulatus]|nr:hypothetical protein NMY22_g16242 [Coprinellus aureogranulatus]